MKKEITLFEMFAGIGSQYKALKNISKKLNFSVKSLGTCDFYIDAIVSYLSIHYGILEPENKLTKEEMLDKLNKYLFSADSKKPVNKKYFMRIPENKLRNLFSYLYSYVDNHYMSERYGFRERERERAVQTLLLITLYLKA
ncbi:DNA (cytosine-5-)-methyltransferase N-terminal subunit [Mycoplasma sp. 4404]|uniref:DNA (cytosine-5-)-methyltransferase N-terminal subunit n=1 Tax=Mycoplasma sp. 4404 TaxID=3108530 RepID=UPI002B1E26B3|nr:DNA methyltransferase [Mycoplasma sp. 4404]MEA4162664.1 DNA methyltransferase [Mycoplasma sp. 4404]